MKSLFTRFGSYSPVPKAPAKDEIHNQLQQTHESLKKLQLSKIENFPLLNEATRSGALLYESKEYTLTIWLRNLATYHNPDYVLKTLICAFCARCDRIVRYPREFHVK
jgi:hypothetical protein